MEAAAASLELEDDVFFKDLCRQISLLIMDDDDDDDVSLVHCPSLNFQGLNHTIHHTTQPSFLLHYNQQMNKRDQSKGTGVFIPRGSMNNPARKITKPGRFTASGNKFQSSRGLPHTASSYRNNHHPQNRTEHSSNPRRF